MFGLAYKMLAEIDWMSLNVQLADLLAISLSQFNLIEASLLAAFHYDVGINETQFKQRFAEIDESCANKYREQIDQAIKASKTVDQSSSRESESEMVQKMAEDEKSAGPLEDDDTETASEETKLSSESR